MKKLTIAEIERGLSQIDHEDDPFVAMVQNDERKGVQQVYKRWKKQRVQEESLRQKFVEMSRFERKLYGEGFTQLAGIDEVGRGPLAGPVVAAAVILPKEFFLPGIDDSKKLSEQKREAFYEAIQSQALAVSVAMVSAEEIDRLNIYEATKKAMLSAVANLSLAPDYLLIDAMKLTTPYPYEAIIGGDGKSVSIAAASIIAKVTRDRYMKELDQKYPQYGFARNMGYGTKEHLTAIETYGITPYHRKSFAPVKDYVNAE